MLQVSASCSIRRVVHAIIEVSAEHNMFPMPAEEDTIMQAFSCTIAGMPGCIGCGDRALIPNTGSSGNDAELYQFCKGFIAYCMMAVCGASLLVTNLVVIWSGSAHNSRIFNESHFHHTLQSGHYLVMVAICCSYLLNPYAHLRASHEEIFN